MMNTSRSAEPYTRPRKALSPESQGPVRVILPLIADVSVANAISSQDDEPLLGETGGSATLQLHDESFCLLGRIGGQRSVSQRLGLLLALVDSPPHVGSKRLALACVGLIDVREYPGEAANRVCLGVRGVSKQILHVVRQ